MWWRPLELYKAIIFGRAGNYHLEEIGEARTKDESKLRKEHKARIALRGKYREQNRISLSEDKSD